MIGTEISRSKVSNVGHKVKQAQKKRLEDAAAKGFAFSQEVAPEDRGTLRQSGFQPEWRGDSLVWGYTAPYAKPQEFGTGPYLAPMEPLVEWAERVGGDWGLARYVWRKIAREGVDASPYVRPGREVQERYLKNNSLGDYLEGSL